MPMRYDAKPLTLLILAVVSCSAVAQAAQMPEDTAAARTAGIDSVTALLGLAPLRSASERRRPGREIRVWLSYGIIAAPLPFLRVSDAADGPHGDLAYWWPTYRNEHVGGDGAVVAELHRAWEAITVHNRQQAAGHLDCAPVVQRAFVEACRARFLHGPDWGRVLAQIDALDPWSLPDPRTLTPPLLPGLDGWSVMVEVRQGPRYRTYSYWAPDSTHGPEAARAAALARLTETLRPQDGP